MNSKSALQRLVLCFSATLSAQATPAVAADPATGAPVAAPIVAHAQAFPDSTLACVSVTPTRETLGSLTRTRAYAALTLALKTRGVEIGEFGNQLCERSGLSASQWLAAMQGGLTIGLTAINSEGQPTWLAVLNARDEVKSLAVALDKLRQADGITATAVDAGAVRAWSLVSPKGRAAYAIEDTTLVFGDSPATVGEAVTRLRAQTKDRSLATTSAYANLEMAASTEEQRLLTVLLRPSAIGERLGNLLPPATATRVRTAMRVADVTRMECLGMTLRLNGEALTETTYLDWPMPRNGLLAELFAPRAELLADTAAAVPANIDSFTLSSVDSKRVFTGTLRLLSDLAPQEARGIQSALGDFDERIGVKLADDLVGKLGDQLATLHWRSGQNIDTAAVIKLNDPLAFEAALRRALANAKAPVSEQPHNGYRTFTLNGEGWQPALAVTEQSVVLATSNTALHRALDQAAAPRGAELAVKVPPGATGYSRAKLRSVLANLSPAAIDVALQGAVQVRAGLDAVRESARDEDELVTTSSRDERFVTVEATSPLGGMLSMATTLAASLVLPQLATTAGQEMVGSAPGASTRQILNKILAAERELRASMPAASAKFGSLEELLDAGLINEADCGRRVGENLLERDGYLITVLLGRGKADDGKSCIAVAWPANNRTGSVYAATPEHPNLVNELMARALGLAMIELEDIYVDGFGSAMRSGWRVEQPAVAAIKKPEHKADAPTTKTPRDSRLASAITTLERGGAGREQALATLRGALAGDQPELIAAAAHALGKLKIADDVPTLTALASKHADPQVRTQAMWALWQINDPRSKQAAIDALKSDDPALRAVAAANLGQLKAKDAVQPLLRLLPAELAPVKDQRDRTAALLALAEIGDATPLLKMAAAVTKGDDTTIQALAYTLQTLSPKLPRKEEATTLVALLDHAQPMVRRYAIQRLGELKDSSTARALEARLAAEDRDLQPLVQVSLQAVRGDSGTTNPSVLDKAESALAGVLTTWEKTPRNHRIALMIGIVAITTLMLLILALRRRARLRAQGAQWAAMVAPSADAGQDVDEVDLNIGDSGVYSANPDDDSLLEGMRTRAPASRR